VASGSQAALMAPTELLAEQHFRSLRTLFAAGGPSVELLTSSVGAAARRELLARLASGALDVVVGTHALAVEAVTFHRLGLAIVDEQHRFGVRQRTTLREKGLDPHLLLTTATPIPRTLTQTIYRDLDLSVIDELPAGRKEIRTEVRPPEALAKIWPWVRERVSAGEQAFVVCPRIDPGEGDDDAPSAVATEREVRAGPLAGLRLDVLHGRLPSETKEEVMRRFAAGETDVVVATTVIEVGVDVPNATVMVVMDAERFGVSQLHQLRGRIGRGSAPGLCLLVTEAEEGSPARARLEAVAATLDGFELSRLDLETRREGDVLGASQSGRRSSLRLLRVIKDEDVIEKAREDATEVVTADPGLAEHPELHDLVDRLVSDDRADYLDKA
jgi:ATP-dependent DNA helicase RecG